MARIQAEVLFHTWAAPRRPVFRVERAGKVYRAACSLCEQGANSYSDRWEVRVRGRNGIFRRHPLEDGPTARAVISHVICSAAWHKNVNRRTDAEAREIERKHAPFAE